MESKNIKKFVKELRLGKLKDAKVSLEAALMEKLENKKSQINTEI